MRTKDDVLQSQTCPPRPCRWCRHLPLPNTAPRPLAVSPPAAASLKDREATVLTELQAARSESSARASMVSAELAA